MPVLGLSRCRPNYLNNIFTWLGNELLQLRQEKVNVCRHSVRSTGRIKHMTLRILPRWFALDPGNTNTRWFWLRFYLLLLHQNDWLFLLTCTLQKSFMASASPRPDGCHPQSNCGKGCVLAFTTPYKSYCWERPNITPNKRLSFILLCLLIVHARYHEGVMAFAGVKNIQGPYRDCSYSACYSACFPRPNKCFMNDQLNLIFFPWWECFSCVHKTAIRDRQPLFLPLQSMLGRLKGICRDPWLQPPAPRQR